jgi:hypothetical protein
MFVIDDINKVEGADLFSVRPYRIDGLVDSRGLRHRDQLDLHETTGRVLRIFEEGFDLVAVFLRERFDEISSQGFRKVGEDVGRVVRRHLLDRLGELVGFEVLGEIVAEMVLEFLHEVGDASDAEAGNHLRPMIFREKTEENRQIRRMEHRDEPIESLEISTLYQLLEVTHWITETLFERIHRHHLLRARIEVWEVFFKDLLAIIHQSAPATQKFASEPTTPPALSVP